MKKILFIIGLLCLGACIVCMVEFSTVESSSTPTEDKPIATLKLDTGDRITIELYPKEAPNTVKNFIYLANNHFYDNMSFSRVVPDYLIQTGDPLYDGFGFPGYFIQSECRANGYKNRLKHKRGTVSMARSEDFNTEGSQFFILLKDDNSLDGQYAAFGQVIQGLEVLEKTIQESRSYLPEVRIKTITVNTFGKDYSYPVVLSVEEQRRLGASNE